MDNIERAVLQNRPISRIDGSVLSDEAATADAVNWIAERYAMSDAFARILLSQLARQDGVTEVAAARGVLVSAVIEAATPSSLP